MKKGQVTIFFLLGLVILLVFGLIIFFKSASQKTLQLTNSNLDSQKISNYVESCLSTSTQDALELVSKGGGAIFADELPSYGVRDSETYKKISFQKINTASGIQKILYGIKAKKNDKDLLTPSVLDFQQGLIFDSSKTYGYSSDLNPRTYDAGPLGVLALPPLCDLNGPNKNTVDNENVVCPTNFYKTGVYSSPSVQEMLTKYINQEMTVCVGDKISQNLSEELGASAEEETASTKVVFTLGSIIVHYNFPVKLKDVNGREINLKEFTYKENVRLLPMFSFIRELLLHEVKYKDFDLTNENDYNFLNNQDGFSVYPKQIVNYTVGNSIDFAYLVTVVDTKSDFLGDYYSIDFLIENRNPLFDQSPASTTSLTTQQLCDMVIDPDDEELTHYLFYNNAIDRTFSFVCSDTISYDSSVVNVNLDACDELGCLTRENPIYEAPSPH